MMLVNWIDSLNAPCTGNCSSRSLALHVAFMQRRESLFPFVFQDPVALETINQTLNYSNALDGVALQSVRAEG